MKKEMKWRDEFYVSVFELSRGGLTKQKIAKALGVTIVTFYKWMRTKPALLDAYKRGKQTSKSVETFKDYVYARLPKKLRRIWRKINVLDNPKVKNGVERIEKLLNNCGKRARQHLWLHAFITGNFNASEACRILNMKRQVYEGWYKNDPDFHELLDGMVQVKKDFFEGALVGKVAEGDVSSIIFVNKTFNADRGYGNKLELQHTGTITHNHNVVPIKDLNLEHDLKVALLEAIRERKTEVSKLEMNGSKHAISA